MLNLPVLTFLCLLLLLCPLFLAFVFYFVYYFVIFFCFYILFSLLILLCFWQGEVVAVIDVDALDLDSFQIPEKEFLEKAAKTLQSVSWSSVVQ